MDNNLLIAIIIGLLVRFGIAFLLKPKKNIDVATHNIDILKNEDLKLNIQVLEKEKKELQRKLASNEEFLKISYETKGEKNDEETDKLLKEIKMLKDELEDIEDELDDQKRNNKKVREEKIKIENQRDAIENEKKSLLQNQEALELKLSAKIEEYEESNQSLTFINNILNAQNSSNKDFEKLDEDTLNIYLFIRNNIINYFEHPKNISDSAWEWRNSELKSWLKNKIKLAIVGEFSAGKTSIINRILSQDNPNAPLLPVSSKETTAIPTYISRSKDFNCQFLSPDNQLRNVSKETFGMVTKSVLDKVNISHLIKYFVLSYDNKYLDNLSILDTPGFASNSNDIIKRTADVVKEADAIFWVIDANTGDINQTSINVMKQHLHEMPLYFVVNKSDTKSPKELDQLESKIKQTAINNNIQHKAIIRFSQKENVDFLMKHIQEIEIQEQPPLMKHISNVLNEIIKDLQDQKKELTKLRKENLKQSDDTQSNFKTIQENISYSAEDIKRFVKQKKGTWFTDDKYQIEKLDYEDFKDSVEVIIKSSNAIQQQVQFHSEDINDKIKIDKAFEENKHQLKEVEQIKKDFIKLITDYNKNLLN